MDARKQLSEIINQVAYGNQSIVLTRRGQDIAAIVSINNLELLQQIEEKIDIEDAKKAMSETGKSIPSDQIWKELGI